MYYPEDTDERNISQKSEKRYFLIHKVEQEDCYQRSLNLNLFFFLYEWNKEKNYCESKRVLAKIINFPAYLCVKLPVYSMDYEQEGNDIKTRKYYDTDYRFWWDQDSAKNLYFQIRSLLNQKDRDKGINGPIDHEFDEFYDIYFYSPERNKPYLYLFFKSMQDKYEFRSKLKYPVFISRKEGYAQLEVHEEKITPLMRLMSRRKLKYNTWFSAETRTIPWGSVYRIGNENVIEYYLDFDTMEELDQKTCAHWKPEVRLAAFDFECYSHRGKKRLPEGLEIKDPIFIVSLDFKILGKEETRSKFCLILGETEGITGAEVIHYKREQDLVVDFSHLIRYIDPDYLMGHNIYGFDIPYWLHKLDIHHIPRENIPNFGRILNYKTKIYEQNWKSSGYGQNSITFIHAPGINTMDMLPTMKRLYKLKKYSLQFLSEQFLKSGKNPITVAMMFDAYKSYLEKTEGHVEKMTEVAKYCIQDSKLVIDLFEKQQIFYHLFALSGEGRILIEDVYVGGEQRRCYSQLANLCYNEYYILQNSIYFDYFYSGGFVGKPIPDVYKFVFTPDFSSLYPSLMQAYNLCYTTFIPILMWQDIPIELCNVIRIEQMEPKTHFSLSRKKDIEDKITLKEQGYNVIVTDEEYDYVDKIIQIFRAKEDAETEGLSSDEEEENKPKKKVKEEDLVKRTYEMRFVKKTVKEGLMPKLQRQWVASRKQVKNELKAQENRVKKLKEQLKAIEEKDTAYFEKIEHTVIDEIESLEFFTPEEIETLRTDIKSAEILLQDLEVEDLINDLTEKIMEKIRELKKLDDMVDLLKGEDAYIQRRSELIEEIAKLATDIIVNDKKQNAIKIVANSGYGFTGVRRGMLVGIFIAMCVTYMGRRHIGEANEVFITGQLIEKEELKLQFMSQFLECNDEIKIDDNEEIKIDDNQEIRTDEIKNQDNEESKNEESKNEEIKIQDNQESKNEESKNDDNQETKNEESKINDNQKARNIINTGNESAISGSQSSKTKKEFTGKFDQIKNYHHVVKSILKKYKKKKIEQVMLRYDLDEMTDEEKAIKK